MSRMKMTIKVKSGFTVLEILVVMIILGYLASIGLPQIMGMVERSRATEALNTLGTIRRAIDACRMQFNGNPNNCLTYDEIGLADPSYSATTNASAHFSYVINAGVNSYAVWANRNSLDNGDTASRIILSVEVTQGLVSRSGTTAFDGVH